jgi:hypothetical protein
MNSLFPLRGGSRREIHSVGAIHELPYNFPVSPEGRGKSDPLPLGERDRVRGNAKKCTTLKIFPAF